MDLAQDHKCLFKKRYLNVLRTLCNVSMNMQGLANSDSNSHEKIQAYNK